MKHLNAQATKIALKLFALLEKEESTQVDNTEGTFMPVHLEKRQLIKDYGRAFSIAHYYTQQGDLMSDPYMEFIKGDSDNQIYPIVFEQHGILGSYQEVLVFNEDGSVKDFRPKMQNDLVTFANQWLRNIKLQQKLN